MLIGGRGPAPPWPRSPSTRHDPAGRPRLHRHGRLLGVSGDAYGTVEVTLSLRLARQTSEDADIVVIDGGTLPRDAWRTAGASAIWRGGRCYLAFKAALQAGAGRADGLVVLFEEARSLRPADAGRHPRPGPRRPDHGQPRRRSYCRRRTTRQPRPAARRARLLGPPRPSTTPTLQPRLPPSPSPQPSRSRPLPSVPTSLRTGPPRPIPFPLPINK